MSQQSLFKFMKILFFVFFLSLNRIYSFDWSMFKCDVSRCSFNPVDVKDVMVGVCSVVCSEGLVSYSSPVEVDGVVYIGTSDGRVVAVDVESKQKLWEYSTMGSVYGTPVVSDGKVFVGSTDGRIYAFNAINGELLWKIKDINAVFTSAVVDGDYLYLAFNNTKVVGIYCVSITSGVIVWQSWIDDYFWSSPVINGENLYICGYSGMLYCLNKIHGGKQWCYNLNSSVYSTPSISSSTLYIATLTGELYAIDITKTPQDEGFIKWLYKLPQAVYSSIAIGRNTIYVGCYDNKLYAIDITKMLQNEKFLKWTCELPDKIHSSLAVAGKEKNVIFVCSYNKIYMISEDGENLCEYEVSSRIETSIAVTKKGLYFASNDGKLHILKFANIIDAKHVADEKPIHDDEWYLVSTETYRTPLVVKEGEPVRIIVKVSSATEISGGKIYYTTDCSTPTFNSPNVDLVFV